MSETTTNARLILHPDDNQIFECMHLPRVCLTLSSFGPHRLLGAPTHAYRLSLHQRYMPCAFLRKRITSHVT